jgi:hypothetical protein
MTFAIHSEFQDAELIQSGVIRDEVIPPCRIVNADQTKVVNTSMGSDVSWAPIGDRQVLVVGTENN